MREPTLEFFDLGGLVNNLNASLLEKDEVIRLGKFEHREPKRTPFLYRLANREIEIRGKFLLRQTIYGKGIIEGILGLDSEINLGYIFLETGYTDTSSNYSGRYEILQLRIKHPLELEEGKVIPNCSIKFLQEREEWVDPFQKRRDNLKYLGLFWVRTDLGKVLPSEWFLGKRKLRI